MMRNLRGSGFGMLLGGLVAVGALFLIGACETGSNGGEGAEFDETLYYTKTDVDAMVATAVADAVDAVQPIAGVASSIELAGVGWEGRTPVGFNVPEDDVSSVFVEVIGYNGSGSPQTLYITFGSDSTNGAVIAQFTLGDGVYSSFLGFTTIPADATVVYGWHATGHAGAATDLTDVSISVRPVLWVK